MNSKDPNYGVLLTIIILVGVILRLYNFSDWNFTNDELSALSRTDYSNLSDILEFAVAKRDVHPAGTQILIHYWIKLFGTLEFAVRFPFFIFSIISIFLSYLVGKSWFNEKTGILTAAAISTFYFPIIYGVLARPYSLGLMSVLGSAYFWIFYTKKQVSIVQQFAFIFFSLLCLYTHYFSGLVYGLMAFIGLFVSSKVNFKRYIINLVITTILFIPSLPVFITQISKKGLNWLGKPDLSFVQEHFLLINNNSLTLVLLLIGFSIIGIYLKRGEKNQFSTTLLITLYILVSHFLIGYLYSIIRHPVLQSSGLIFSFPFYLLFVFNFFPTNKIYVYITTIILLGLGSATTVLSNKLYTNNHFGVFKELALKNLEWNDDFGKENITHITHLNNQWYFDFYYKSQNKKIKPVLTKIDNREDLVKLKTILDSINTPFLTFSWSSVATNPEIYDIIMDKYPTIVEQQTHFNSQATLFNRTGKRTAIHTYNYGAETAENKNWNINKKAQDTIYSFSEKKSERLDSINIYSSSIEFELNNIHHPLDSIYIGSSIMAYGKTNTHATLVIEFKHNEETVEWYGVDIDHNILSSNSWQKAFCSRAIPKACRSGDKVKIYVWNRGKEDLYLDNFMVNIYSRENIKF